MGALQECWSGIETFQLRKEQFDKWNILQHMISYTLNEYCYTIQTLSAIDSYIFPKNDCGDEADPEKDKYDSVYQSLWAVVP